MQIMELEAALSTRDEEADALRQRLQSERKAVAEQQQSLLELRSKLLQVVHPSHLRRPSVQSTFESNPSNASTACATAAAVRRWET